MFALTPIMIASRTIEEVSVCIDANHDSLKNYRGDQWRSVFASTPIMIASIIIKGVGVRIDASHVSFKNYRGSECSHWRQSC